MSEVKEAYVSLSTQNQKTAAPNHEYALKSLANQKYLNVWELKPVSLLQLHVEHSSLWCP